MSAELEIAKHKIEELESQLNASMLEIESLKEALARHKRKVKRLWKENCDLSLAHEDEVDLKDNEIAGAATAAGDRALR